jgi:hypothetical protein
MKVYSGMSGNMLRGLIGYLLLASLLIFLAFMSGCTANGGVAVPQIPKINLVIPVTQAPMHLITQAPPVTPTVSLPQNVTVTATKISTVKSTYTIIYV